MPELGGQELLGEWRKVMDSLLASASSVGGRADITRQLLEPMQRQLELVQKVIERERRLQKRIAGVVLAPMDAVFDLLEESGVTLREQAEALQTAGRALEETAGLVKTQAELFERTIAALREPAERAKMVAGLPRRERQSGGRGSRRPRSASASADRR
jgi:uncharacterized protein YukE